MFDILLLFPWVFPYQENEEPSRSLSHKPENTAWDLPPGREAAGANRGTFHPSAPGSTAPGISESSVLDVEPGSPGRVSLGEEAVYFARGREEKQFLVTRRKRMVDGLICFPFAVCPSWACTSGARPPTLKSGTGPWPACARADCHQVAPQFFPLP